MASCRDVEGWHIISQLRELDFTLCFEEGVILTSLLALLLLSATCRIWALRYLPSRDISRKSRWRLWAKLTLLGLAIVASCFNLFVVLSLKQTASVVWPHVLEPLALLASWILTRLNHRRTRSSSTILLLFWPCYTVGLAIWTRSFTQDEISKGLFVVLSKWAVELFSFPAYVLECVSPDDSVNDNTESPVVTANVYSIWSFAWLTPLMQKGSKEFITENDLPALLPRDESENLGNDLQSALDKHSSVWLALFLSYGGPYMGAAFLKLLQDSLAFLQPQLLRWLLAYISNYQSTKGAANILVGPSPLEGYIVAIIMFVTSMAQSVVLHQYFQICFETGMRVRAGLVTAIYKKSLVLSSDERGSRASGDIVNLMSVDATRLQDLCTYGLIAISGPFQVTLAFVSLYNLLGWSAFVGVAIMIFSVPLNTTIARMLKKMQEQQMKNRDKRTRLMSELLANIKSIKLYAWEYAFIRRVLHVRNDLELKMLKKIGIATALNTTLFGGIPLIVAFSSFATASVFSSRPLTADVIFPAISLFMLLQFPLAMFSQVTSNIIEALVSVKRLSGFLHAEELQQNALVKAQKESLNVGDEVLSIKGGEFQWNKQDISAALEDVNLTVHKGELVGVLGRVGSGKSSLLSAIIGDMRKTEGEVALFGNVAYAAQNPWILSATVRDNILFSHEYDEVFYDLVIEACALKPDLELLSQGDLTEVGEKGMQMVSQLSGGQRARVGLARAIYARADLVLLDDVLAAVDSHVARHVFDHVIGPQGLLATKARILVTNSISYLKYFDQLVYLRRGIILESGSYNELMSNSDSEVRKLVHGHAASGSSSGMATPGRSSGMATPTTSDGDGEMQATLVGELESVSEKVSRKGSFKKSRPRCTAQAARRLFRCEQGRVKMEVYSQYLHAASRKGFLFFVLATVLQQAVSVMSTVMLKLWGEHNRETGANAGLTDKYFLGYGFFILVAISLNACAALLIWVFCSLRSSKYLHDSMLHSVMRAPLSFFETTPSGRILNLFSRDTYVVDQILARVIQNLIRTSTGCASIILVIGFSFPPFLIAVVPLAWFYSRITTYYLATSRELKRLDAVSRSPIFAWFSESLAGLSTIRAYDQQSVFIANNARRIDRNQVCYLPSIAVNRWLAIRLEFVGGVILFVAAVLAVSAVVTSDVDAGLVGLVLSYALNTTGSLNWFVRSASEVEQNVVSVERIVHYAKDLEHEAPYEIPEDKPASEWPTAGEVEFREYSARYRPGLDLVLKDISMTIKPREKIGICGRTGAGKSSLLLALFRIIEPASGTIFIDKVDITKLGLHDLRSAISIVPQSPDLFEGTLRENIDPAGEHQDVDIWTALEHAHLKAYIESLPGGLDAPVQEAGSSLSAGQRQLLCFARALLRKVRAFVLVDSTSAVDLDTDRAIQEIIRGPIFRDVTILTIAHRLNTIMESDRVLVLDAGKIAEFDTPKELLENKGSMFRSMAMEAGLVQVQLDDAEENPQV
ncbi:P-loop containing nucleoside triphosphate hydrolase protein [Suillus subalutaceus]|uniref:P-loop containing nucleoside triphosphate hydrolase protein n=1 Tax=Suillus subalutaceus TaxID=48586 RepID=UPI001B876056|nr:P-loop containing nucleoside triphosphate hydrolase protein [Suillus subalutaceus]KAG1838637.1 P-loop containing nucleoside triphosphate hydrolase protein [Suillus subalutaceus]